VQTRLQKRSEGSRTFRASGPMYHGEEDRQQLSRCRACVWCNEICSYPKLEPFSFSLLLVTTLMIQPSYHLSRGLGTQQSPTPSRSYQPAVSNHPPSRTQVLLHITRRSTLTVFPIQRDPIRQARVLGRQRLGPPACTDTLPIDRLC
jgi:hypothetical protein